MLTEPKRKKIENSRFNNLDFEKYVDVDNNNLGKV